MDWETNSDALQSTLTQLAHLLIESSRLSVIDDSEVGFGGYGDVFLATLDGSSKVAVKQLRIIQTKAVRVRVAMRLARELKIWAKANHRNVLKLIGYHLSEKYDCAQLISPYMENGNIVEYMKRTQASIEVRLGFVRDITSGLAYLHGCNPPICHGDIKPLNVLISAKPDAVLCDFGLALFIEDSEGPSGLTTSRSIKASPRYMSPELLDEEEAKHTLESDIWAWACTIFEIITDVIPYANLRTDRGIRGAVGRGVSPGSVELLGGFAPHVDIHHRSILVALQALIPECWKMEPGERPSSSSILSRLNYGDLGNGAAGTELNREFLFVERALFAYGDLSDLYLGRWEPPNDPKYPRGIDVAIKVWKLGPYASDRWYAKHYETCGKETFIFNHPRITPIIGYIKGFVNDIDPCIVSPRRQGNIAAYITTINPQADRLRLLCQALEGLIYLHTFRPSPIIHLAIKPKNILVTDEGTAELSDFVCAEFVEQVSSEKIHAHPFHIYDDGYTPPEKAWGKYVGLLNPRTDIYATGLVILYVLSGKEPWYYLTNQTPIGRALLTGDSPNRPYHPMEGSKEAVKKTWDLLRRCWRMQPDQRPSAQEVLNELLEIEALGGVRPPAM